MDCHTNTALTHRQLQGEKSPRGLVFGRWGSVGGSTTGINISFVSISLATRSPFGSRNFLKDWLRNGISLGLKLKDTN